MVREFSRPPPDMTWMNQQMASATATMAELMSRRIRYAKVLTSDASGIYTGALGAAGLFAAEPAVSIDIKMASDNFDWRYSLSGTAVAGYAITVVFTRRNNSIIGNLTQLLAGISLINTPVATTFSLIASEQT